MILGGRLNVEDALDHLMSRPLGTEVPLLCGFIAGRTVMS